MKLSVKLRWLLLLGVLALVIGTVMLLTGWRPNFDRSIVLTGQFGKVENGSAFDKATVDLGKCTNVIVPDNAEVRRQGTANEFQVFMKKTLGFAGHPPERMSIRVVRKYMGCAVKVEGDSLMLATFGEWDSQIEGGTRMRVVLVLPQNFPVETRAGLSGPESSGREWHGEYLTKPKGVKEGYWYGPASPAQGWMAVPDSRDPKRRAEGGT